MSVHKRVRDQIVKANGEAQHRNGVVRVDISYSDMIALYDEWEAAMALLKKIEQFLDGDIATLPCTSRQRDLPEEMWEHAMFLRDLISEVSGG